MSPDHADRVWHLFNEAADLPADARSAFLDAHCRNDPALRQQVEALLQADQHAAEAFHTLDQPLGDDTHRLTGQTVGHYEVLGKLGGGGMGVVYRARDTRLDRTVALKFLPPPLSFDAEAKERFIHEAKAASALDHAHICTIYEIGETTEDRLFIAMACYDGETLKAKLAPGPLPVEQALEYAMQMAEGLQRAHEAGIVHRDVKPANVMITARGQVKLLDFGLAKVQDVSLTRTGTTLGTVAYMSPEQARGEAVDHRTDVWSLGVVLYEMLAGHRPFRGEHYQSVIYSILHEMQEPIRQVNPAVPPALAQIVDRALQKEPAARYGSAAGMLKDLTAYQESLLAEELGAFNLRTLPRRLRRPRVAVPAAGVLLLLILGTAWFIDRQAKIRWAREEALPEIERLVEVNWRDYTEAYALAEQAERYLPNDPDLGALMDRISLPVSIRTEPSGAAVYMKKYDTPEAAWTFVGVTPIDSLRMPIGIFRWRMEKAGYETVLAAAPTWDIRDLAGKELLSPNVLVRVLDEEGSLPEGMVRVPGTATPLGELGDFFIDRYEVTNAQYKAFIDAGGYRNRAYWKHAFVRDEQVLSWEEAMAAFVDQTGRPGPSTWQAGDYPAGHDDYPVSGISWYEAAAYAEYAGKTLPTGQHWGLARGEYTPLIRWPQLGGYATFAPFSNFGGEGPVPVGSLPGFTSYGAYDMAGNVREWCWNETPQGRLVRGGAWNDNTYRFTQPVQAPPFDRSATNGFRCALYPDPEQLPETVFARTAFENVRNFYEVEPVSDAVFEVYKQQFAYDQTDLHTRLESRDESAEDWIHERISVNAAYGDERLILHLFLPTNTAPPYQTVIYFPGSASLFQSSSEDITTYYEFPIFLSFLLKNGRAVLYPVYKGTFERRNDALIPLHAAADSHSYTEYLIQLVKDFRRSIDYLETREDLDRQKLAYYGMSWGGLLGPIITAVEDRLQASILAPGVLIDRGYPEANQLNYITRVRIPTLMLNGRYDTRQPYETVTKPMFDLLGTPEEHKALKLYDTDHIPPRNEYIKETLAWLDRYLGPVETGLIQN